MKPLGSIAALIAAISDDAAEEADGITAAANERAARISADSEACPATDAADHRASTAREWARRRIAQEDWEDRRAAIAERELWIARAIELGTGRLAERQSIDEARTGFAMLAREALARLPSGPIEIVVPEADTGLLDREWRALLIPDRDPDSIRIIGGTIAGGCIARTADGRASFDNTYAARAERLQATWRAALADVYDRALERVAEAGVAAS